MKSRLGIALAGVYLLIAVYFIATQGLFGESFVALILGMPWALVPAYFEYGGATSFVLALLLLIPIALNTLLFYWVGSLLGRLGNRVQ